MTVLSRYLVWGRYAGYTQGSSEYSVKSLTEREAAKLLSSAGVRRLYTPCPDTKPGLNNAGDNKQQQQQGEMIKSWNVC